MKYLSKIDLSQFAENGIEIHEIHGYHDNLFVSPQVEILGKQLKQCLEKAQAFCD